MELVVFVLAVLVIILAVLGVGLGGDDSRCSNHDWDAPFEN